MVFTQDGKSGTALLWIGSTVVPDSVQFDIGSQTWFSGTSSFNSASIQRGISSKSGTSARFVEFVTDFNSIETSGLTIRGFGVTTSGASPVIWSGEYVNDLTCDGTVEVQVEVTWEVV